MKFVRWLPLVILGFALAAVTAPARSQGTPPAAPLPEPTANSQMAQKYDGNLHITLAPYIWGPTVKLNTQYSIPTLPGRPVHIFAPNIEIGPSSYLPKVDSAFMAAFEIRKGILSLYGDGIYLNASTSATFVGAISGPLNRIHIPYTVNTVARISPAIWELAAGVTLAHNDFADVNFFAGTRQFPISATLSYNAVIGRRGIIAPAGNLRTFDAADDMILGLRGQVFFDRHLFVPYYGDFGNGSNNQSWQAYGGAGYAFDHGQTIVAMYRALNYFNFPLTAHTQKFNMAGPLIGYTFNI
jgi:hypothetical protein